MLGPVGGEVTSFRLILSDTLVEGGQRVKTFPLAKGEGEIMTIDSIISKMDKNFDLAKLCATRSIEVASLATGTGGLNLVGIDGPRHVHIHGNEQLQSFFKSVRNTKLPSVEVKLSQPGGHKPVQLAAQSIRPDPKDRIEELEDNNFQMSKATQKVEQAINDMERARTQDRDEAARMVTQAKKELTSKMEQENVFLKNEQRRLASENESRATEIRNLKQIVEELDAKCTERHEKVVQQIVEMGKTMAQKFEEKEQQVKELQKTDESLKAEDSKIKQELGEHNAEMKRLDEVKVEVAAWTEAETAMTARIDADVAELKQNLEKAVTDAADSLARNREELDAVDKAMEATLTETSQRLEATMKTLNEHVDKSVVSLNEKVSKTATDLEAFVKKQVGDLASSVEKQTGELKGDVKKIDVDLRRKIDELTAKNEATFVGLADRLDNLVKAERSRLGTIERDLAEGTAKLRSDCRAEVERVRVDYEQEAARLDGDLADLHMKNDVLKQEINFFQSRLLEQKDWCQRQLAETATATRAAQVDAQEGVAAATKMAHALRDDQVAFRDKMGKHISLLQHASDSYGDAINALETQRSRMRLELDAILKDHTAYVTDMDGWADDVRVKVERLFRAMEPPRCEWNIRGAVAKMKALKKPLALKSPAFSLQGLREVQFEFYPYGHNNSQEGKSVLRLCMPPNALVRYQTWLGRLTEGSKEYKSGGCLSVDITYDGWKDQLQDDGSLIITMEVLQDLNNNDDSLARAVHLESE